MHHAAVNADAVALTAFVLAVVLLASTTQTAAGFGGALVAAPLLILALPVKDVVVVTALIGAANTALVTAQTWQHIPRATVRTLLLGSFAGMPLGLLVLLFAPADALRLAVGVASLVMAIALAAGLRLGARGTRMELAIGAVSGVLQTSTSMNGPPVVIYLQDQRLAPPQFRGGMAAFLLVTNCVSLVLFAATGVVSGRALALGAAAMPVVLIGNYAGARLTGKLSPEGFRTLVLALLAAASLTVIATTLVRMAG